MSDAMIPIGKPASGFDRMGGHPFFAKLVAEFYALVATDDLLRPMYPPGDLEPAERRLRMFLEQYWGGPTTYSEERGHPRLRMRHAPYAVTPAARDRWLDLMGQALATCDLPDAERDELWQYMERAANFLVNSPEE